MAGDLAPAKALVANLNLIISDLEDRYGPDYIECKNRARTVADSERVSDYAVGDLRSLYTALNTRVNLLQDSA